MKGWAIFKHSVQLVLNNLDVALRVSLLLYLPQVLNQFYLLRNTESLLAGDSSAASSILLLNLLTLICTLWIAVSWHRFVLLGEAPGGWLPGWQGSRMLGYLGRSFLIGILVGFGLLICSAIIALVPGLGFLMAPGLVLAGSYFFFRLGVILPAGTIDRNLPLSDAWKATKDKDGAIVVLALILALGAFLVRVPSVISDTPGSMISLIYGQVTGWFLMMFGVSTLTTLYGHYVEGRPID